MRDVAMPRFGLSEFLPPFHQATVTSDLGPGQIGQLLACLGGEIVRDAKFLRGSEYVGEEIPHDLLVHGRAHRDSGPLPCPW